MTSLMQLSWNSKWESIQSTDLNEIHGFQGLNLEISVKFGDFLWKSIKNRLNCQNKVRGPRRNICFTGNPWISNEICRFHENSDFQ